MKHDVERVKLYMYDSLTTQHNIMILKQYIYIDNYKRH